MKISTRSKVGKSLSRSFLNAIKKHCRTKSARNAPPITMRYSHILCRKPNLTSIQRLGYPNPYHTIIHYRSIPCLNAWVGKVRYLISLLKYSLLYHVAELIQSQYIVEQIPTSIPCWGKPSPTTLLSNSQFQYNAELYSIPSYCWGIPNINAVLRFAQIQYNSELYSILTHCLSIPYLTTLSNYDRSEKDCWRL